MGIPDHLTCLLTNLYAGKEETVRTLHRTMDWFQIEKEVSQGCILSPYLYNFYAECIMQNARLDEAQARIKIARRNINNLRYVDDTTLMAESKEERSDERRVGKEWKQCQTLFFGAPKSLQMVIAPMKLKDTYSLEGKL